MTTPELITDEIVEKATKAYYNTYYHTINTTAMRNAILAIQDDITRPVYALLDGWKRDAQAYEKALKEIRDCTHPATAEWNFANDALKGEYHEPREGQPDWEEMI